MKKTGNSVIDQTRIDIIEAYVSLVQLFPTKRISIGEIAQKSGFSRSTFYRYFRNVQDLKTQINLQVQPKILFSPKVSVRKPIKITLEQVIDNVKRLLNNNLAKMKMAYTPETREKFEKEFTRMVTASLLKSSEKLSENAKDQLKLVIRYHAEGSVKFLLDYAQNFYALSVDEISCLFAEMHFYGVFAMMDRIREKC